MCGKDDALQSLLLNYFLLNKCDVFLPDQDLLVLVCVWCVWCPLRKQGCVSVNPFVGHSHSSISSSGGKKTSRFQQVEHTPAKQCVHRLYEGLCGPHTFSLSSPLTLRFSAPTTDVFTHSHRRPQWARKRKWSSGKTKQCLFCISKAQCKVWEQKIAVLRGVVWWSVFIQGNQRSLQEVTVSSQEKIKHISPHKSANCHFHTSVFVWITHTRYNVLIGELAARLAVFPFSQSLC